jgi:MFS family permease
MENGVFNPLWGPVIDRVSPKKLMVFGVICTSAGMICLSFSKNLAMYYAGFLIAGVGSSLISGMLAQTIIARWFRKDMGKVSGILYTGTAASGILAPVIVMLIDKIGWQHTLLYAAIGFLVIGIPLSLVTDCCLMAKLLM